MKYPKLIGSSHCGVHRALVSTGCGSDDDAPAHHDRRSDVGVHSRGQQHRRRRDRRQSAAVGGDSEQDARSRLDPAVPSSERSTS